MSCLGCSPRRNASEYSECKKRKSDGLVFVTGNKGKLQEVQQILADCVPRLSSMELDLPELQGEPEDISRHKCLIAAEKIGGPVIVEDTSLCFNALSGLPGPYIKWFLDKLGHEGLNNMLAAYDDKTAFAQCIFSLCSGPGQPVITFAGKCPGKIVAARGPNHFGWDPVFEADGTGKTFAEMTKSEKNAISHRSRALRELKDYLSRHPEALQSNDHELVQPDSVSAPGSCTNAEEISNSVSHPLQY